MHAGRDTRSRQHAERGDQRTRVPRPAPRSGVGDRRRPLCQPLGLGVGSTLLVTVGDRRLPLKIRGLLKDDGPARVLDGRLRPDGHRGGAAGARAVRPRRPDRDQARERDEHRHRRVRDCGATPSGLTVQRPAQRGRQVERMLAAFHLNLTALSYIALLVGLFLVYNTVSVAVLSRRGEIGALRGARSHARAGQDPVSRRGRSAGGGRFGWRPAASDGCSRMRRWR